MNKIESKSKSESEIEREILRQGKKGYVNDNRIFFQCRKRRNNENRSNGRKKDEMKEGRKIH